MCMLSHDVSEPNKNAMGRLLSKIELRRADSASIDMQDKWNVKMIQELDYWYYDQSANFQGEQIYVSNALLICVRTLGRRPSLVS